MNKKIISWTLLIFWLFVIFYLSSQSGSVSGSNSGGIISFILNLLNIKNTEYVLSIIHNPLRELMHFLEYFILGILVINVLSFYRIKKIVLISIILCFIYSVTDEIHQVFVPNRTFEYLDIMLDLFGSILGVFIFNLINKKEN